MSEEKNVPIEVVYLGKRELQGGGVGYAFITVEKLLQVHSNNLERRQNSMWDSRDDLANISRMQSIFKLKKAPCHSVGGVYSGEGEVLEDGRVGAIVTAKLKWDKPLPAIVAEYVLGWRVLNDAVENEKRRLSAEKNATNDRALEGALSTLKSRYMKIPAGYRRGFQLWLLGELDKR